MTTHISCCHASAAHNVLILSRFSERQSPSACSRRDASWHQDSSPAEHMWTIADCNDPTRFPLQYAEIMEHNRALKCKDCPHHYGAECIVPGK